MCYIARTGDVNLSCTPSPGRNVWCRKLYFVQPRDSPYKKSAGFNKPHEFKVRANHAPGELVSHSRRPFILFVGCIGKSQALSSFSRESAHELMMMLNETCRVMMFESWYAFKLCTPSLAHPMSTRHTRTCLHGTMTRCSSIDA